MADITGESLEKVQPLLAGLPSDISQEPELIVGRDRQTGAGIGRSIPWLFDQAQHPDSFGSLPRTSVRFVSPTRPQMGGTKIPPTGLPGLAQGYESPTHEFFSDDEPPLRLMQDDTNQKVVALLHAQLAEQRKIVAYMKQQTELLNEIVQNTGETRARLGHIYRTGLLQVQELEKIRVQLQSDQKTSTRESATETPDMGIFFQHDDDTSQKRKPPARPKSAGSGFEQPSQYAE